MTIRITEQDARKQLLEIMVGIEDNKTRELMRQAFIIGLDRGISIADEVRK